MFLVRYIEVFLDGEREILLRISESSLSKLWKIEFGSLDRDVRYIGGSQHREFTEL